MPTLNSLLGAGVLSLSDEELQPTAEMRRPITKIALSAKLTNFLITLLLTNKIFGVTAHSNLNNCNIKMQGINFFISNIQA